MAHLTYVTYIYQAPVHGIEGYDRHASVAFTPEPPGRYEDGFIRIVRGFHRQECQTGVTDLQGRSVDPGRIKMLQQFLPQASHQLLEGKDLRVSEGEMIDVKITEAMDYDLVGEAVLNV